jgi:DNA repair ATPase RecN
VTTHCNEDTRVLENRVSHVEKAVDEIRDAAKSIDASLKVLARLEVAHGETREGLGRAFKDIEDHEDRLREIEKDMPTLKQAHGWVVSGVIAVVGLAGLAVWKVVVG